MSNKITHKKTTRKFYNKFIYKIQLEIPGASALRWYDFPDLIEIFTHGKNPFKFGIYNRRDEILGHLLENRQVWLDISFLLAGADKKSWQRRLEGDTLDLYTHDKDLFDKIYNGFSKHIKIVYKPEKNLEQDLLDSKNTIYVKKLPHDLYNYKVYLKPHKLSSITEERIKLCEYLRKLVPSITFTPSIESWILSTYENWDRRYIYVDNEQTLLMLNLKSPDLIGKVMNYKLR